MSDDLLQGFAASIYEGHPPLGPENWTKVEGDGGSWMPDAEVIDAARTSIAKAPPKLRWLQKSPLRSSAATEQLSRRLGVDPDVALLVLLISQYAGRA